MKLSRYLSIPLLFLLLCTLSNCTNRFGCNASSSVLLGQAEYSEKFQRVSIESGSDTLRFYGPNSQLEFVRDRNRSEDKNRFNVYKICSSIDVKPYTAYAYYEYENKSSFFIGDSMIITVEPTLSMEDDKIGESLYLNISTNIGGLKGRVPVSNIDLTKNYTPYSELFKLKQSIVLNGQAYSDVWKFSRNNVTMYYQKSDGILGLEIGGEVFVRRHN